MSIRKLLVAATFCIVAFTLIASCEGMKSTTGTPGAKKSGKELAKVGTTTITLDEFKQKLDKIPPFYRKKFATKKGQLEYLDKMVEEELFYQEALKRGLEKDPEYTSQLEQIKRSILSSKIKKDLMEKEIKISDDEIKKYYDEHPDQYQNPETIKVRQILVRLNTKATPEEESAAKKKIDEVYKKLKSGLNFEKAADQYSDDKASAKKGGLIAPVRKGLKSQEFDNAAFAMSKPNEISAPFKDRRGWNILQFVEKTEASAKPFDQVKTQIERKLKQDKQKSAIDEFTAKIRSSVKVVIHDDLLKDEAVPEEEGENAAGIPGMPSKPSIEGKTGPIELGEKKEAAEQKESGGDKK